MITHTHPMILDSPVGTSFLVVQKAIIMLKIVSHAPYIMQIQKYKNQSQKCKMQKKRKVKKPKKSYIQKITP